MEREFSRLQQEAGLGVHSLLLLMGDVCAANIVIPGTAEILVAI